MKWEPQVEGAFCCPSELWGFRELRMITYKTSNMVRMSKIGCHHQPQLVGVTAGQFQQWKEVTHEMLNDIGTTEWQVDHEKNLHSGM